MRVVHMKSDSCFKVMPYLQMKFFAKEVIKKITSDKCTGFWINKTVKRVSKTKLSQSILLSLTLHFVCAWELRIG